MLAVYLVLAHEKAGGQMEFARLAVLLILTFMFVAWI